MTKESYTPQETQEIARSFGEFIDGVVTLESLAKGGSMRVVDVAQAYNRAVDARKALLKVDCSVGLEYGFEHMDRRFGEVSHNLMLQERIGEEEDD